MLPIKFILSIPAEKRLTAEISPDSSGYPAEAVCAGLWRSSSEWRVTTVDNGIKMPLQNLP